MHNPVCFQSKKKNGTATCGSYIDCVMRVNRPATHSQNLQLAAYGQNLHEFIDYLCRNSKATLRFSTMTLSPIM
jgi:hypothetical protein